MALYIAVCLSWVLVVRIYSAMIRLWILVLTLALLTGSAYGSLTFWMSLLGLGPAMGPPPPPPPMTAPIIVGSYGGGGCAPKCSGNYGLYGT